MKIDEIFKNCFTTDEMHQAYFDKIAPILEQGDTVILDWENKNFRLSLIYNIINRLISQIGLDGFKKKVKIENVNNRQKSLIKIVLNNIFLMK